MCKNYIEYDFKHYGEETVYLMGIMGSIAPKVQPTFVEPKVSRAYLYVSHEK